MTIRARALTSFVGDYGTIRTGQIFICEPSYFQHLRSKHMAEEAPALKVLAPQRHQAMIEAPKKSAGAAAVRRIATTTGGSGGPAAAFAACTVDRWAGETVTCIASGPSLKQVDVDHVRGKSRCIVINTSFRAAPWADVLYACDHTWWQQYFPEAATGFRGAEMWTCAPAARNQFKIHYIHGARVRGLSRKPSEISTGLNSGYQAIGLAHLWGAKKILLLGYDFQRTAGRVHWHPDHPRKLGNGGRFADWVVEMHYLASDALVLGLDIINCSRQTALRCFPRSTIQEQLP